MTESIARRNGTQEQPGERDTMVVTIFRSRIREAALAEIEEIGGRMYELAAAMPGFMSYKEFAAEDGETITIIEFESPETLAAWREHPEHRKAQQRGREFLFEEFHIQVCTPVRDYRFP